QAKAKDPVPLDRSLVTAAAATLGEMYDKTYGGFGAPARNFQGTKFPTPTNLDLLQYEAARTQAEATAAMVTTTLEQMARGRFYVWTDDELKQALPVAADREFVRKVYGIGDKPNFEDKYQILTRRTPLADVARALKLSEEQVQVRLEKLRQQLFDARAQRPRPFRDTKILTAWNGKMIAGVAAAGEALGDQAAVAAAGRAAAFVLDKLRTPDGRLLRT